MRIVPAIHSSFPRIGEGPDEQKLRRAFASLEEARITCEEFEKVQDGVVDEVLVIQENAGIEIVTDGLIRWYDPASNLARNLSGFEINGLLRFFDTNFYYRQPVASESISSGNGALADEIEYIRKHSKKNVKAVLLGPLTLACMSLNKSKLNFDDFTLKLADILSAEIAKLSAAGATVIQVEEPSLVRNPGMFNLFKAGFQKLAARKGKAQISATFYFGDAGKIVEKLPEIPADILGIDFTYSPGLLSRLMSDGFPRNIAFGVLDGRNTKMESATDVAHQLEPVLKKIKGGECHITTSCGLEFLPRTYAKRKLELSAEIARLLNG